MSNPNRLYPLCALAMSAHLVDRLANTGLVPYDEFEVTDPKHLNLTPGTPLDVYGGTVDGLKPGSKRSEKCSAAVETENILKRSVTLLA